MYKQIDLFSDLVALQLGIIHPTISNASKSDRPGSINEAFESMTEDEVRSCKRKFRKVLRNSRFGSSSKRMSPKRKRLAVMMEVRTLAWNAFDASSDNDE
jgi:hypothetical protein